MAASASNDPLGEATPGKIASCLDCGYQLAAETRVCSECGLERTNAVRMVEARRAKVAAVARLQMSRTLLVAAMVILVYASGVISLNMLEPLLGFIAAGCMAVAIVGALAAGWLVSRLWPVGDRVFVFDAWVRAQPYLHAAWLVAPVHCVVALLMSVVSISILGTSNGTLEAETFVAVIAMLSLVFWLVGWCVSVVLGIERMCRRLKAVRANRRWPAVTLVIAATLCSIGAVGLGIAAGLYAAIRVPYIVFVDFFGRNVPNF